MNPGDAGDTGQRLAAEAERGDREQVVGAAEFRSGMALEGKQGVVANHAAAVVDDADQLASTCFDLNSDAS